MYTIIQWKSPASHWGLLRPQKHNEIRTLCEEIVGLIYKVGPYELYMGLEPL